MPAAMATEADNTSTSGINEAPLGPLYQKGSISFFYVTKAPKGKILHIPPSINGAQWHQEQVKLFGYLTLGGSWVA